MWCKCAVFGLQKKVREVLFGYCWMVKSSKMVQDLSYQQNLHTGKLTWQWKNNHLNEDVSRTKDKVVIFQTVMLVHWSVDRRLQVCFFCVQDKLGQTTATWLLWFDSSNGCFNHQVDTPLKFNELILKNSHVSTEMSLLPGRRARCRSVASFSVGTCTDISYMHIIIHREMVVPVG